MTHVSKIIAAPRWRHFIPVAESFAVKIPSFKAERDPQTGKVGVIEKFRFDYVAGQMAQGTYTTYQLPAQAVVRDIENITISYNGSVQDNQEVILYYDDDGNPITGRRTFFLDESTNTIIYQRTPTGINRAPRAGVEVVIEIINNIDMKDLYIRIPMKKEWFIQGANPLDPTIVDPSGMGENQFQGGYRCTLKLISRAANGHARISDDKFAFEYRPDMGFYGTDSFAFRMVNAMGQESSAYCIRLDVGTDKLKPATPTEGEEP